MPIKIPSEQDVAVSLQYAGVPGDLALRGAQNIHDLFRVDEIKNLISEAEKIIREAPYHLALARYPIITELSYGLPRPEVLRVAQEVLKCRYNCIRGYRNDAETRETLRGWMMGFDQSDTQRHNLQDAISALVGVDIRDDMTRPMFEATVRESPTEDTYYNFSVEAPPTSSIEVVLSETRQLIDELVDVDIDEPEEEEDYDDLDDEDRDDEEEDG